MVVVMGMVTVMLMSIVMVVVMGMVMAVVRVVVMVENLRHTMEEFIVYVSGLGDEAFEAPTTPTTIMMGANSDADEREKAMRDKLVEHEQVIRRAEIILSTEIVITQQVL